MNSLLKRQVKKFLNTEDGGMELFLEAVNQSYADYNDQIALLQRAMKLSSDELFAANQKLIKEAESLKEVNHNLEFILNSMRHEKDAARDDKFNATAYIKEQSAKIVEINHQRETLLASLEKQNEELNEYAHVVSHDLKSPLRNINTLINWIFEDKETKLSPDSKDLLDKTLFNMERMDLLVKGILEYSSIDRLESENRVIDFNYVVDEIKQTIALPENITLTVKTSMPKLYGNFYRYRQLLQNLIDNAIKFNDKECGYIEVGCQELTDDYKFYVKDNGVGIPDAYFHKIFKIFTRLDNTDQSSGIGLSIVKKILNFYGGKIWLESVLGEGTTFYFTLPKKAQNPLWQKPEMQVVKGLMCSPTDNGNSPHKETA
ncbi:sensor histidine kinase [Flavobacterium rhizosphaerae]|uniref:histidine kinase n=1 Tax=Flavobacterium rhizosphaerae TaxID=3163298 RepID=A0ABW8YX26_9FLAO